MQSSTLARSVTVRAIGPSEPLVVGQPPYTPPRLTSPIVGRRPVTPFQMEGRRIEAKPSCPIATVQKFADTAAPEPPDEPPAVRSRSYTLRVEPNNDPCVSPPPSSPSVTFPRKMTPASRSFLTTKPSRPGL